MKNLDFYKDLLNHSLCYKYNVQLNIAKEYCKILKEGTILKSILITSTCPNYITDIFRKNGIKPIIDDDNKDSLFYEFNEILKEIKSDKKFNYEIIVKNFCCKNIDDIRKYVDEINMKLQESNNTNIGTILALLIDVPNYYLDSINLMNKYEYKFETMKPGLNYKNLFLEVYRRMRDPNSFNIAIKELAALVVLYYELLNLPMNNVVPGFLNPIVEPVKTSLHKHILAQHATHMTHTIDTFTTLDYIVSNEREEDFINLESENHPSKTSFHYLVNGYDVTVYGETNINDYGYDVMEFVKDVLYSKQVVESAGHSTMISEENIMSHIMEHDSGIIQLMIKDTVNESNKTNVCYITPFENELYLLFNESGIDYDLRGVSIPHNNERHKGLQMIGIDYDSDKKYKFVV